MLLCHGCCDVCCCATGVVMYVVAATGVVMYVVAAGAFHAKSIKNMVKFT